MIPGVDYRQRYFEDVVDGEVLDRLEDPVAYRRVIMNPAATWDFFPGHHDPEYARSQGQPTIYVNTMHLLGFIDKMATDWGGPASFVQRRRVAVARSVYAGDTMVAEGRVIGRRVEERSGEPWHLVELEITVTNQRGELCAPATVVLRLPSRASA